MRWTCHSLTQHLVSAAAHHDTWADLFLQQRCILAHAFSKITIWFLEPMNVFLFCRTVEEVVFIPSPFNGFMMCCVSSMWHLASIRGAKQNWLQRAEAECGYFFLLFFDQTGEKTPKGHYHMPPHTADSCFSIVLNGSFLYPAVRVESKCSILYRSHLPLPALMFFICWCTGCHDLSDRKDVTFLQNFQCDIWWPKMPQTFLGQ